MKIRFQIHKIRDQFRITNRNQFQDAEDHQVTLQKLMVATSCQLVYHII